MRLRRNLVNHQNSLTLPFERVLSQAMVAKRSYNLKGIIVCLTLFLACDNASAPPGRILIKNDILDKQFNEVAVDQVGTKTGGVSFRKTLKPSEHVVIPALAVTRIRFSRKYKDHTKVYYVQCPGLTNEGVVIKLIDVHTGRMNGGCKLTKKGEMREGVMRWDALSTTR